MPWPSRQRPALRPAVTRTAADLHALATSLLERLVGGAALERARARQAVDDGDCSVLDCFVYPNEHAELPNMRAHTDPGLLTLTIASRQPGLQLRDRASGAWVDVEAGCVAGRECVVFGGEALELATGGRYAAALHRVRHAPGAPRVSSVFELRIGRVPAAASAPAGERAAAPAAPAAPATSAARAAARAGVASHAAAPGAVPPRPPPRRGAAAERDEAAAAAEAAGLSYCARRRPRVGSHHPLA